jgi:flagellar FliL protein
MAEEQTQEQEEDVKQEKSGNNKMLIIILVVVLVLVLVIGGVVAFLLLGSDDEESADEKPKEVKEKVVQKPKRVLSSSFMNSRKLNEIGVLYPLDTFTVNLKSDAGRRYLKCTMSLELEGEELSLELDAKSAVLRDRIIRILTSKTLEEISSKKGKAKVSQQIMDTLNSMISDGEIKGIYFTEFVIQ